MPDLQHELEELYGGPLDAFTAGRNDLVRRLRAAGQSDEAERMAALRKPSLPVWAVNRLVRHDPEGVALLVESAERIEQIQTGRAGTGALAEAVEAHRAALQSLVDVAGDALERPPTDDVRQRVSATLRAASLDPASREQLLRGMLQDELSDAGFDLVASLGVAAPARRTAAAPTKPAADANRKLRERLRVARAALGPLRKELAAARTQAGAARRAADEADARAAGLEEQLAREEDAVAELERELDAG